jgi:hypothetical protein
VAEPLRGASDRLPSAGVPGSHRRPRRDPSPPDPCGILRVLQPVPLPSFTGWRCACSQVRARSRVWQGRGAFRGRRTPPSLRARRGVAPGWTESCFPYASPLVVHPCTRLPYSDIRTARRRLDEDNHHTSFGSEPPTMGFPVATAAQATVDGRSREVGRVCGGTPSDPSRPLRLDTFLTSINGVCLRHPAVHPRS